MEPYPLKQLAIYVVKKDFTSDYGYSHDQFSNGQRIQYLEKTSDIYGMTEIIQFKDMISGKTLTWHTHVDNLYDHWNEYLNVIP